MSKETKTDILSQILRKLCDIEYIAHLAHEPLNKTKKKPKSFFNCKINVRTGFLYPKNVSKDTTI